MRALARSGWFWGLALALAAGAIFRLAWVGDIEYKGDEALICALVRDFLRDGRVAAQGIPSSQNLRNPGLCVWVFYPLGAVFGAGPTGLARGVQVLNILALVALVVFAWRVVPRPEREWWLWAAALASVNPVVVLLHRKIWPPTVLPLALVALLACWWYRERRWGSLGWGLLAALLPQVHLAGLFHAAALVGYTWLLERRTVWRWWLVGAMLGALPAVPWACYVSTTRDRASAEVHALHRVIEGKFFSHWMTEPLGVGLGYALGRDTGDLAGWPRLAGRPTHGVAVLQAALVALGAWLVLRGLRRWWRQRPGIAAWLGAGRCPSDLLLHAAFWGFGLLLTFSCLRFYRHYLLWAFPLPAVWLARLALPHQATPRAVRHGRRTLLAVCVGTALLTAALLGWIHQHGGTDRGEYGRTYASQVQAGQIAAETTRINAPPTRPAGRTARR